MIALVLEATRAVASVVGILLLIGLVVGLVSMILALGACIGLQPYFWAVGGHCW